MTDLAGRRSGGSDDFAAPSRRRAGVVAEVRPVSEEVLVRHLVDRILERRSGPAPDGDGPAHVRVLVDGPAPARPGGLADLLVEPLHAAGAPVARIRADDFLRPASLRLEHGRRDPDAYLEDRLDVAALVREVLAPLGPGGTGRFLPVLRDAASDRSVRAAYVEAAPGTVLVVDGELLLGRELAAELVVHLALRPQTLARRLDDTWLLPAFARYEREVRPQEVADVVVRVDDPRHPALAERVPDRGTGRSGSAGDLT